MKGKIFNAQEVQAIIAGNKTMFREVIKAQPNSEINPVYLKECNSWQWATKESRRECPYQVGQEIFCKEVFCKSIFGKAIYKDEEKEIRGFGGKEVVVKWKPAQHMRQEQSRITLEITGIKVERLGDISEENLPQGFRQIKDRNHFMYDTHIKRIPCNCGNSSPTLLSSVNIRTFLKESAYKFMCPECKKTPNETYITSNGASCYWNDLIDPSWREKSESTHKKPEEKFEANPFVWVVDFKVNK